MITITIPAGEMYDEANNLFITFRHPTKLTLEHSLLSISKWEAKWHKAFLGKNEKTYEESVDYIRCMTLTQNVDPNVYLFLTNENVQEVSDYITNPMTATWFSKETQNGQSRETITSELIYYWMVALQIPFECEKWHLNRLLTLVQVCNIKNSPPKKMTKSQLAKRNSSLNAARRKALNSKG